MKENKYSSKDFTKELLPSTRRAQFKDLFKNEWKTLLTIGFVLLLFALPYIVFYALRYVGLTFYVSALKESGIEERQIAFSQIIFNLICDGINIVPYIVFSIGLSGVARVLSNLIYNEGVLFKDDFSYGIKKNFKAYLIAAIVFAFFKALYRLGTNLLSFYQINMYSLLTGIMIVVIYLFVVPTLMFAVNLATRYNMTFRNLIKVASTLGLITIIPTGIFSILLFFVLLLPLIAQLFIIILVMIIIIILILPLYLLLFKLFVAYIFDKHINSIQYPDFYRKGLSN